ncbi:MAG TPA: DNA repair protein RecN [Alphaproteobacteria bacterium]|nr:DNA repair protein RecN [Alphaproteobacteria bacterium]
MLARLVIHDVVLIEKLALQLEPGLNVFTGETGAGKSILLDALGLALGARSDAALIRSGANQASVTAEFALPDDHGALKLAEEQGLSVEMPLILRRVIAKDGKSRAFLNDQPISIGLLKQFGEQLLEIHGQFETHGLLNPGTHRGLLDAFANLGDLKEKLAATYEDWRTAEDAQKIALQRRDQARAEEDFLRAAVEELEKLSPEQGEADKLAERRTNLQHREKITDALQSAEQSLNSDKGAVNALAQAGKAVARIADKAAGLQDLLASIDRAANEAAEASTQLDRFMRTIDAEPDALQRIEERLFSLRAIARKHGVQPDGLAELHTDLKGRLSLLNEQGDQVTVLAKAAVEARHAYKKRAEDLSTKRQKAAAQLEKAIAKELPPLKLERAQFKIEVAPLPEDQWSAEGMDRVAFLASTNPGSAAGSLQKIASGGELARFMLALKVVLAASDPVPTLVFDEVDSGIGGATASAVGERLGQLAEHVQILVVTHSPQVAARGNSHLRVMKQLKAKQASTMVEILDADARQEEIARMLAGSQITDAARKAALSLIEDAAPTMKPAIKKAGRAS